jgi:flagellar hook-associated protein 1
MSNLLASLVSSATSLDAYDKVLETTQNNVANSSTPGYAKLRTQLYSLPFDPNGGTTGGVRAGEIQSARAEYAEQAVWRQNVGLGREQQNVASLTGLQSLLDISGESGLPKALNQLFQSFSAWGATPTSDAARRTVMDRAMDAARAFQQTAAGFATLASDTANQVKDTIGKVNQLVGELRQSNMEVMQGVSNSGALDARTHAILEDLSQYIDFSTMRQTDGTVTLLLNGETPLLIGDTQYNLTAQTYQIDPAAYTDAPPLVRIVASDGTDVTSKTTDSQLGALLTVRNQVLPCYIGDGSQPGDLNRMAKQFADRVNQILTGGEVSAGFPGAAVFQYDTGNDTNVARSLTVSSAVSPNQLGANDPGPPAISNGIPLALSALAAPDRDADKIDGVSFAEFYGRMASQTGSRLQDAQNAKQVQQSLVAQAKELRQQISGVSLDEEATILIQFQRGYQAVSRFITILDRLTEDIINMMH